MVQIAKKASVLHRSRIDIIATILRVALEGARKTHIMYRCNLSFRQLNTYLEFLTERKLIKTVQINRENNDAYLYQTTARGKAFIQAYNSIRVLISTTELETNEWGEAA